MTSCTTTTCPSATWRWGGWWRGAFMRTGRAASGQRSPARKPARASAHEALPAPVRRHQRAQRAQPHHDPPRLWRGNRAKDHAALLRPDRLCGYRPGRASASRPQQCRARFGIAPDRFVVCVGYSASSAQQQLEVLEALQLLPAERLRRMTLVVAADLWRKRSRPMWPAPVSWRAALPCQTVVLTQFLGPEDSAMLRLSADVFILAIRTDAFSASMQEYLYAGACVLKGAWQGYPSWRTWGSSWHPSATLPIYPRWWRAPWTERSPALRPISARSSPASTPGRPCERAGCPLYR